MKTILDLFDMGRYDEALRKLNTIECSEYMTSELFVLKSRCILLSERQSRNSVHDAKKALNSAIFCSGKDERPISEMGHFIRNIEDNPKIASQYFIKAHKLIRSREKYLLLDLAYCALDLNNEDEAKSILTNSNLFNNAEIDEIILNNK